MRKKKQPLKFGCNTNTITWFKVTISKTNRCRRKQTSASLVSPSGAACRLRTLSVQGSPSTVGQGLEREEHSKRTMGTSCIESIVNVHINSCSDINMSPQFKLVKINMKHEIAHKTYEEFCSIKIIHS